MPQPHLYTASHRSPKLPNSQQKYFKDSTNSLKFLAPHPIEMEAITRSDKENIPPERRNIGSEHLSRKDDKASKDFTRDSFQVLTARPSSYLNLRLTISSPLYKKPISQEAEQLADEGKELAKDLQLKREATPLGSTSKHNLTWLSPINRCETEDSEENYSESYHSFEEGSLEELSPIYTSKTIREVSDESKAFLRMFKVSRCPEEPGQGLFFKTSRSEEALSKEMSTDLSIEIHQIDNVTRVQESEGTILPENDMILVGLNDSSACENL